MPVILSIDESIQRLKGEILAQDWRLSPRRLEYLEAAFACLKNRFKSRKGMLAILAMADGVIDYMKKREEDAVPPETVDFLKETMAHVVSLYEDRDYDPDHEAELYQKVFARFSRLKQKVQSGRDQPQGPVRREAGVAAAAARAVVATPTPAREAAPSPEETIERLRMLLARRDGSTDLLRLLLVEVTAAAAAGAPLTLARLQALLARAAAREGAVAGAAVAADQSAAASAIPGTGRQLKRHEVRDCPTTSVRHLAIGSVRLVVPEGAVALARPLQAGKRTGYLRGGRVPLLDLSRLFHGLAGQFSGPLAEMKDRQLRKLALPVMTPLGVGLPEMPDDAAEWLVVISHGNWHGAIFCREVDGETAVMNKFQKGKNGDIVGTAYLEAGGQAPLLDVEELLRREGFLSMA